jgi:hypothetical protein
MKFTDTLKSLETEGWPMFLSTEFLRNHAQEIINLVEAAEKAKVALNDWMLTYAPEMCEPNSVEEAKKRVYSDGTLYYIAAHIKLLGDVLAALNKEQ